ncbi:MAG: tol-pal system protein YbgF [Paracoccaceae bacterium]|nr:tol-pal system protein YbgF [Paracoccaceae bacterium]
MTRLLAVLLCLALPGLATAQERDETLADIRQELTVLFVEIQKLQRELSTTGGASANLQATSIPDRVDALEAEVQRLTAKTEELENRIARVVDDGTNRIGDLEFRLVELEGGDISTLGETTTLGQFDDGVSAAVIEPADPGEPGMELAIGEQSDFDLAMAAFEAGDYQTAADRFQTFSDTYLGGPLTGEAHFMRGQSLEALGMTASAARAYLASYSGDPAGARAPEALLYLGLSLDALGQISESCVTLGEVTTRFPQSAASIEAQTARAELGCT